MLNFSKDFLVQPPNHVYISHRSRFYISIFPSKLSLSFSQFTTVKLTTILLVFPSSNHLRIRLSAETSSFLTIQVHSKLKSNCYEQKKKLQHLQGRMLYLLSQESQKQNNLITLDIQLSARECSCITFNYKSIRTSDDCDCIPKCHVMGMGCRSGYDYNR